jgi:dipeptidyl aminopeptidase/acylaminoacyl peptidase
MVLLFLAFALPFQGAAPRDCDGSPRTQFSVQWSRPVQVVSPHRKWSITVKPDWRAEENRTSVVLHACGTVESRQLFTLTRSAEINWSSDGQRILVVNKPTSDSYEVLFSDHLTEPWRARPRSWMTSTG